MKGETAKNKCPVNHSNSLVLITRMQDDGTSYQYCDYCKWVDVKSIKKPRKKKSKAS